MVVRVSVRLQSLFAIKVLTVRYSVTAMNCSVTILNWNRHGQACLNKNCFLGSSGDWQKASKECQECQSLAQRQPSWTWRSSIHSVEMFLNTVGLKVEERARSLTSWLGEGKKTSKCNIKNADVRLGQKDHSQTLVSTPRVWGKEGLIRGKQISTSQHEALL